MTILPSHHYQFSALLTAVMCLLLVVLVCKRSVNESFKRQFILYYSAIFTWSLSVFVCTSVYHYTVSYFFNQLAHVSAVLIPVFFLHFTLLYLNRLRSLAERLLLSVFYAAALFFEVIIVFSPSSFFSALEPKLSFPFFPTAGRLYTPWVISFAAAVIAAHLILLRAALSSRGIRRTQISFFVCGNAIGYLGGVGCFFPVYDFPHFPFPYGPYGVLLFSFVSGYAILKHRFIDVVLLTRRTIVFASLFSVIIGIFSFVLFVFQNVAYRHISANPFLPTAISVVIIVIAYDPIRNVLVRLTDRYLFQRRYDYRKILRDASQGLSRIKSLHHLASLVVHFMTMRVRVRNAGLLIRHASDEKFAFEYARGYLGGGRLLKHYSLSKNDPLIQFMSAEHAPLDVEQVKEWIAEGSGKAKKRYGGRFDFNAIKKRMDELNAACCVPSFLGNQLRNILVLGEKKSGDFYTDGDLQVLYTLAQESAIAVENARLFDQAVDKAKELAEINQRLEKAQSDLIRALEETEITNKKLRDTHVQLIHEQKMATLGRLASSVGHEVNNPLTILSMNVSRAILKYRRNPDLKVVDVLDIFQKMEQNISRIKAVVNTLTGLLKKSEKGKFEPLSLKLILEETLPLVQFQTYLDNLSGTEVEFNIPANLPLIKGDLERLQEVFLNLFINAYHAMTGKRERKITVRAQPDPARPRDFVICDFSDNGCGMNDDVLKRIFSYGFTTRPLGKGSGMGLYMCRYIIELHGGEIKVRSRPGEGTTFLITLPIFREPSTLDAEEVSAR